MGKIVRIDDVNPLYKIENDVLVSKNADLTVGFEIILPEIWTMGEDSYEALHTTWVRAIKNLPPYTIVHKQDIYYNSEYSYDNECRTFLQRSYARHFNGRKYLKHKCYLFFTKSRKEIFKKSTARFSPLSSKLVPQDTSFNDKEKRDFFKSVDIAISVFSTNDYCKVRKLTTKDYIGIKPEEKKEGEKPTFGLLDKYVNLSFSNDNLTLNDLHIEDGTLMVGKNYVSIFSLSQSDQLPTETSSYRYNTKLSTPPNAFVCNSFPSLLGERLGFEHIYNQYFFIEDNNDIVNELSRNRNLLFSTAPFSKENEINGLRNEEFLNQEATTKDTICKCAFNIIAWDKSFGKLEEKNTKIAVSFTDLECKHTKVSDIAPQIFWGGIAGAESYYPMDDTFLSFVEGGCDFLMLDSNYRDWITDSKKFHINLCDRIFGIPIKVDLDDMPMQNGWVGNRNKIIVGPSGSGKSFFINNLLMQYYEMDTHVVIVDVGDSYQGLSNLIKEETDGRDGTYFTYKEDSPISFNPFYVSDMNYSEEKIDTLVNLIILLWKDSEKPTQAEQTFTKLAIDGFIQEIKKGRKANFNSFYEYIDTDFRAYISGQNDEVEKNEMNIGNLLHVLIPYYKGGRYDFLLNSDKELNLLNDRFIVFELDNIKNNRTIFPIVTLIIMDTFLEKMRRINGRKFMLIEEAWQALSQPNMAEFVK